MSGTEGEQIIAQLLSFTSHKEGCQIGRDQNNILTPCSCGLNKAIGRLYKVTAEMRAELGTAPNQNRPLVDGGMKAPPDSVTYLSICDGPNGVFLVKNVPREIVSMELLLVLRGALKTLDTDIHTVIKKYEKEKGSDIDDLIGNGNGVGPDGA